MGLTLFPDAKKLDFIFTLQGEENFVLQLMVGFLFTSSAVTPYHSDIIIAL